MQNPLTMFLAWRALRRSERQLRIAEHRRAALMAQIAARKNSKAEWRPMVGMLRQATEASLRASVGRR